MKTPAFLSAAVLVVGVALGTAGCANQPTIAGSHVGSNLARPARNFALAVSLPDGGQLTPQQWAIVKATFQAQLAAAGYTLVDDLSLADKIIRVVFTPAEDDPTNGNAVVMSVRPNPVYAYNTSPAFSPSYVSMRGTNFFGYGASSFFNDNYYGYDSSYYSGSPRVDTPHHSRPNHPVDCPPNDNGTYASHHGQRGGGDGHGRSYPGSGSQTGGTYTRLDRGSGSSYSADSPSSSYSSRSYSTPSSSSLTYSGGSSSSYSSPSSSSYSAPSSSSLNYSGGSSSSYSSPSSSSSSSYSAPSSSSFSSGSSSSSSSTSSGSETTATSTHNAN